MDKFDRSKLMYKGKINLNYTTLFNTGYFIGTDLYTLIRPSLERSLVNDLLYNKRISVWIED